MSVEKLVPAFYIHVDGRRYGPYRSKFEDRILKLVHLKGVAVEHVMAPPEDVLPPRRPRPKKAENLSLFDGLDWMPTARKGGATW